MHCHYCQTRIHRWVKGHNQATTDHKIPLSRQGTNRHENRLKACYFCNNARGDLDYEIFYRLIKLHGRIRGCYWAVELRRRRDRERAR